MNLPKKVMLHPGDIRSKNDGDIHFIGSGQLARLYGVLPIDDVVTYDPRNPTHSAQYMDRHGIYVLHLYPSIDGKYEDIHAMDDYQPIMK